MTTPASTTHSSAAPSPPPLHPRLAEIVQYLAQERAEVLGYVLSLPAHVLTQQPEAGKWSVANTMEHLALIEDSVGRLISTLVKQAKAEGGVLDTETSSILGCLDRFNIEDNTTKLRAPERVQPKGEQTVAESIEKLAASRAKLLQAVDSANGLDLGKVAAPHPFLGPFSGYEWLMLVGQHEVRHLKQIKDAVRTVGASAS